MSRSVRYRRTAAILGLALFALAAMVHGKTPRSPEPRFVEIAESAARKMQASGTQV